MAGDEAGEVERSGLGEAPEYLPVGVRAEGDAVRAVVHHVGRRLHQLEVFEVVLQGRQDELVVEEASVGELEAHRLALADLNGGGLELHPAAGFRHGDFDGARRQGAVAPARPPARVEWRCGWECPAPAGKATPFHHRTPPATASSPRPRTSIFAVAANQGHGLGDRLNGPHGGMIFPAPGLSEKCR
jgi:hypothetical protein